MPVRRSRRLYGWLQYARVIIITFPDLLVYVLSHALLPEGSLSLDLSGRTRHFTHIRFIRSFSNPVQEPLEQPGFLKLFRRESFF